MRRIFASMIAAALLIVPQLAEASSCYIREYTVPGINRGLIVQIAQEQGLDQMPVSISGSSAASAVFKSTTNIVRIVCGASVSFNFGTAPAATTSNSVLPSLLPEYFAVSPNQGWSVAFISNASP